jgi:ubiquinone/menaquinone biosynthesis C-methylase UbiE
MDIAGLGGAAVASSLQPLGANAGDNRAMTKDDTPELEFEDLFGDNYYYFYELLLTAERTKREADAVWKLLALEPGKALLDLGCGHGRMANALAEQGARVTGLDASPYFLEIARKDAASRGVDVTFVEGDMRAISWENVFDAALIWYTTFGYFNDSDNENMLNQIAKALKPGARILVEQINRVSLLRGGMPATWMVTRGDDIMIDCVDYDGLADRSVTERIVVRNGQIKRTKFFVRLYSPIELSTLMRRAGFQSIKTFGQDGEAYSLYGKRLILVGSKT